MATYTKETALYDTGAIKDGVDDAATKATNYLSADSSGIMVYDGSNGAQTPSNPSSTTNNVFIDDDSLDIRKGTDVLATFGASGAQIGKSEQMHTNITGSSVDFSIGNDAYISLDSKGIALHQKKVGSTYEPGANINCGWTNDLSNAEHTLILGSGNSVPNAGESIVVGVDNSFDVHAEDGRVLAVGEHLLLNAKDSFPGYQEAHLLLGEYNDPSVRDYQGYVPTIMIGDGSASGRSTTTWISEEEVKTDMLHASSIDTPVTIHPLGDNAPNSGLSINRNCNWVILTTDTQNDDSMYCVIDSVNTGAEVRFGVSAAGNRGIYDVNTRTWLVRADSLDDYYLCGINVANLIQKSMIARGSFSAGDVSANSYKDITVSFGKTFSSVPTVVCCISSTSTAGAIGSITASPHDETTTGCKIRVFNAGSATRSPAVRWIATNA